MYNQRRRVNVVEEGDTCEGIDPVGSLKKEDCSLKNFFQCFIPLKGIKHWRI